MSDKIKGLVIGFLLGGIVFSSISYAAIGYVWRDTSGSPMGTTTNPVYVEF